MTSAELVTRRAALLAIPPGVLTVQFNGRSTTFDSTEAIAAELARIDGAIAALAGRGRIYRLAVTSKLGHAATSPADVEE